MKRKELSDLLERHIELYISNIAFELEKSHDNWFESFGFPLFGDTSKPYHEQVYFQSYLESYTRNLINGVLKDIADQEVAEYIAWPEFEYNGIYRGYTNSEYEKEFGFELIVANRRVGYRYSELDCDLIEELLLQGNVDIIEIVRWEKEDGKDLSAYGDVRVKVIDPWALFAELFNQVDEAELNSMYELFVNRIADAIGRANAMISLTTLPGFTPNYLNKMRNEEIDILRKEAIKLSCFKVNNYQYKRHEEDSKRLVDTYRLSHYFLERGFENIFVGKADFAKSFLTSEYLYRFFKDNPMFDYTPIVSGYLKSVEQLLHSICSSCLEVRNIQKDLTNFTLGDYTSAINNEKGIFRNFFRKELKPARNMVVNCLHSYRKESRNNLFHKDYFSSWNRVEQIRINTIFLYVVLSGAADPVVMDKVSAFSVLNTDYDRMFYEVDGRNNDVFLLLLGGKEYSEMRLQPRFKGLQFNENGLITNTLIFKRLKDDSNESIEISRHNTPSGLWTTSLSGEKIRRIWPIANEENAYKWH